jgi:hypothetical protein
MFILVTFERVCRIEGRLSRVRYATISGVGKSCYAGNGPALSQPFGEAINRFDELVQLAVDLTELCG